MSTPSEIWLSMDCSDGCVTMIKKLDMPLLSKKVQLRICDCCDAQPIYVIEFDVGTGKAMYHCITNFWESSTLDKNIKHASKYGFVVDDVDRWNETKETCRPPEPNK